MTDLWPFDQPPNCAVITLRRIVDGGPILFVSHDKDDDGWQFLDGESAEMDEALVVSLKSMLDRDPTLRDLADLPVGWIARRQSRSDPWRWESRVDDVYASVHRKVLGIFADMVGQRAERLDGSCISAAAKDAIAAAMTAEYGDGKAQEIALHMADWNWDAAFVVAVHLFPERFTADEIKAGIGLFLCHAPNHIRAACQLTGEYVWENFPSDDERTSSS